MPSPSRKLWLLEPLSSSKLLLILLKMLIVIRGDDQSEELQVFRRGEDLLSYQQAAGSYATAYLCVQYASQNLLGSGVLYLR